MYPFVNKRFTKRANEKRGILFNNEFTAPEDSKNEATFSVKLACKNPDLIKYNITEEGIRKFRNEAHIITNDTKQNNFSSIIKSLENWWDIVSEVFSSEKLSIENENTLYSEIYKMSIIMQSCKGYLKTEPIEHFMPKLINILHCLVKFPDHLKRYNSILTAITCWVNLGDYFRNEKYNFINIAQAILAEYSDIEIIDGIHSILGNLAYDENKTRDLFLQEKFTEHLAYILEKYTLEEPTILYNTALTISCYLNHEITDIRLYKYFDCLLPSLNSLLYSTNLNILNTALDIRYRLTINLPRSSEFYKDLCNTEIMLQILKIANTIKDCTKNCLRVLWNTWASNDESIKFLIDHNFTDILLNTSFDWNSYTNCEIEILGWLYNLSLSTQENIEKWLFPKEEDWDESVFDILVKYIDSKVTDRQVKVLKILNNLLLKGSYDIVVRVMERGYIKAIDKAFDTDNHNETKFWGLSCIDAFLNRDSEDREFANYFTDIEGFEKLCLLQEIVKSNDLWVKIDNILRQFRYPESIRNI